jgi:NADPH2:quinone reductase
VRRVTCLEFGDLADLVVEDVPSPDPGPGQVVVDVRAAGVNFVDALFVQGRYQIKPPTPFTPGGEVAGVISAVGDGVSDHVIGDRVIASCGLGGYAEQVVVGTTALHRLPDDVSFEIGAGLVQSYATAMFSLTRRTELGAGEWLLVLGAGGGVGRACVDVGRMLGAHVIGVASSEDKRKAASDAGAEATIDPGAEDVKTRTREISGGGADVVLDPVGGELAEMALRSLRTFGRYLVVGFVAGIPRLPLNQVLLNNRNVIGVDWGAWAMRNPDENRVMVGEICDNVAAGKLRPADPTSVPLAGAAEVLRELEERKVTGKVVLIP